MLVIVGTSEDAHSLRSQVGIGPESDCLFGQFDRILWISDSEAGGKDEKSAGTGVGDSECGEDVTAEPPIHFVSSYYTNMISLHNAVARLP